MANEARHITSNAAKPGSGFAGGGMSGEKMLSREYYEQIQRKRREAQKKEEECRKRAQKIEEETNDYIKYLYEDNRALKSEVEQLREYRMLADELFDKAGIPRPILTPESHERYLALKKQEETCQTDTTGYKLSFTRKILEDLYNYLKGEVLIPKMTKLDDFLLAFRNGRVRNKITWLGTKEELVAFLKKIEEVRGSRIKNKLRIAANVFLDKKDCCLTRLQLDHTRPNCTSRIDAIEDYLT